MKHHVFLLLFLTTSVVFAGSGSSKTRRKNKVKEVYYNACPTTDSSLPTPSSISNPSFELANMPSEKVGIFFEKVEIPFETAEIPLEPKETLIGELQRKDKESFQKLLDNSSPEEKKRAWVYGLLNSEFEYAELVFNSEFQTYWPPFVGHIRAPFYKFLAKNNNSSLFKDWSNDNAPLRRIIIKSIIETDGSVLIKDIFLKYPIVHSEQNHCPQIDSCSFENNKLKNYNKGYQNDNWYDRIISIKEIDILNECNCVGSYNNLGIIAKELSDIFDLHIESLAITLKPKAILTVIKYRPELYGYFKDKRNISVDFVDNAD